MLKKMQFMLMHIISFDIKYFLVYTNVDSASVYERKLPDNSFYIRAIRADRQNNVRTYGYEND